jgi:hypothetical protein
VPIESKDSFPVVVRLDRIGEERNLLLSILKSGHAGVWDNGHSANLAFDTMLITISIRNIGLGLRFLYNPNTNPKTINAINGIDIVSFSIGCDISRVLDNEKENFCISLLKGGQ